MSPSFEKAQSSQIFIPGQMAGSIYPKQVPSNSMFHLLSCHSLAVCYNFMFSGETLIVSPLLIIRQRTYKWIHHIKLLRRTQVLGGPVLDSLWYPIPSEAQTFIICFILFIGHREVRLLALFCMSSLFSCTPGTYPGTRGTLQVLFCSAMIVFISLMAI